MPWSAIFWKLAGATFALAQPLQSRRVRAGPSLHDVCRLDIRPGPMKRCTMTFAPLTRASRAASRRVDAPMEGVWHDVALGLAVRELRRRSHAARSSPSDHARRLAARLQRASHVQCLRVAGQAGGALRTRALPMAAQWKAVHRLLLPSHPREVPQNCVRRTQLVFATLLPTLARMELG